MSSQRSADPAEGKAATPNDLLRAARQRTASRTSSGRGLSRQELAELVNTWVWDHHNETVEHSANWVGALERGKIRWPREHSRAALRKILGAPTDAALGFTGDPRSARGAETLEAVDRQQLLRTSRHLGVLAALGPVAAFLEGGEPTPTPRRIGATDIAQVRAAARVFDSWGDSYGGNGFSLETVMDQLRWSAALRGAICLDELRPELHSALGDLAGVAGYLAADAGADEQADRVYHFALACAEKAGDWPLRAQILSYMVHHAIRTGQPDEGLTLAEHGLVRADRLTAAGRSQLHADRGHALARMHRINEALTAIGTADDHFADLTPDNEPLIMAYYNDTKHASITGHALAELAILGRNPGEATDRLTAAATRTEGNPRAQAIRLTNLASLTMATGDPLQAATIGHAALDAADTVRSRCTTDYLRELAQYADKHQHLEEVEHLQHRITTMVCATNA